MKAGTDKPDLVAPLLMGALGIVFCLLALRQPVSDFGNYYFGSALKLANAGAGELADPWTFNAMVRIQPGMGQEKFFLNYAPVPPFSLLFYLPFTFFPVFLSKLLFNLVSVGVFTFSFYRLLRSFPMPSKLALFLPFVFLLPLKSNIYSGQSYLLITAFLIEGFLADERSKPWNASFWFSLAVALKIFPVFILVYLLLRKRFTTFFCTLAVSFLFVLSGMYFIGWSYGLHYMTGILPRLLQNEINNPYAVNYQSVFVFLKTIFVKDALLNPTPPFHAPLGFEIFLGIFSGLLMYVTVVGTWNNESRYRAFSITLLFGFLSTAYASVYSLLLLILPAVSLTTESSSPGRRAQLALLFLICLVPVWALDGFPWPLRFPRLYLLLLFYVLFTIPYLRTANTRWLMASVVLFVTLRISLYLFSETDDSTYYLSNEEALLIGNYHVTADSLILDYLTDDGVRQKSLVCRDAVSFHSSLEMKNNQVYMNGQPVTSGADNKRKPAYLNGSEIIYLSDKYRGVGFYTLRKISFR